MMAMMGLSSGWFVGNSETILPTDDPTRRHSSAEQGFEQFWVVLADNVTLQAQRPRCSRDVGEFGKPSKLCVYAM
jgi:hypothetical protein